MSERRIDWEDVKGRLEESQRALERALTPSAADLEALFRARAALLTRRQARGTVAANGVRVLVFGLANERYALEFADVAELLPLTSCTPVPGAPPQLLGVINVHGEIRSVVDLGRLLELPGGTDGYVLLVRKRGRQVGLRVDAIDKILQLDPTELAVPGDGEAGATLPFLRGLTPERIRLLSTDAIFAHPLFRDATP